MIRAVVDTSILIRYLIKPSAAIRKPIEVRWLGDEVQMVTAPDLIAELEGVLKRDHIQTLIRLKKELLCWMRFIRKLRSSLHWGLCRPTRATPKPTNLSRALWWEAPATLSQRTETSLLSML